MIIEIFLLFTALAFILTITGYYVGEDVMILMGFFIFGLMAIPLLGGDLEFRSGATIIENTSENTHTIDYDYETYGNTVWYGIFFILLSAMGGFLWVNQGWGIRKNEDD